MQGSNAGHYFASNSELKIACIQSVANVHIRQEEFENNLLPLLSENFHFSKICPVSLNVEDFGSLNALQRVHLLSSKHSLDEIERLFKNEVTAGVNIRAGFSLLSFLDVYLQSVNVFFTSSVKIGSFKLSVSRIGFPNDR